MDEVIRVITFFVEKFYNLKTHLRGRKYIIKQKKDSILRAQKCKQKKDSIMCSKNV